MRILYVATALLLVGLPGLATAGPGGDEAFTLDLSAIPGGPKLYVMCSNPGTTELLSADCGVISIWQQTNGAGRLQSAIFSYGGHPHPADEMLLG